MSHPTTIEVSSNANGKSSPPASPTSQSSSLRKKTVSFGTVITVHQARQRFMTFLHPNTRQIPGIPVPASLAIALSEPPPDDATCYEASRDAVLRVFAHPTVSLLFTLLACLMCLLVVVFGLLIAWAVLGLFLNVQNGWTAEMPRCRIPANSTHFPMHRARGVPKVNGQYITGFCNLNQVSCLAAAGARVSW